MDLYTNPRGSGVRLVQYVAAGTAVVLVLVGFSEGEPAAGLIGGAIALTCLAALELFFIRSYVTRVSQDANGWVMHTLTTFGERPVRFEASQARIGGPVERYTLYDQKNVYYPFHVAGRRYILDATPPAMVDVAAFQRHFPS